MPLVTRAAKGFPLTHSEMDANLLYLDRYTAPWPEAVERTKEQRLGDEIACVLDWGSGGTGNDDTALVQKALVNELAVAFPKSSAGWGISAPVNLRSGQSVLGRGRLSTVFQKADYDGPVFRGIDVDHCDFAGFRISGPGQWTGVGNKGISLSVATNEITIGHSLRNVLLNDLNDICVYVGTGAFIHYLGVHCRTYGYCGMMQDGGDGHAYLGCSMRDGIVGYLCNRPSGYGPTTASYLACYAEQAGVGFQIIGGHAVALSACGVEAPIDRGASFPGRCYHVSGGDNIQLLNSLARLDTIGAGIAAPIVLVDGGATQVRLDGFTRELSASLGNPAVELEASAAGSVLLGTHNFSAGKIASGGKISVYSTTVMP